MPYSSSTLLALFHTPLHTDTQLCKQVMRPSSVFVQPQLVGEGNASDGSSEKWGSKWATLAVAILAVTTPANPKMGKEV